MNKHVLSAIAIGTAPAAAFVLVGAVSPAPASASPAPAAHAVPQAARLKCGASMTNKRPRDYTSTGVKVRTVGYARIRTVAHYKTTANTKYRTASSAGRRTVWYYISGATPGYRVVVDVYVSRHGRKGSCSTSFTPRS